MTSTAPAVLCVYRYDPMDRLADCSVTGRDSVHCFYQKNLLSTQIQGQVQHTLLRTDEYLLAQQAFEDNQTVSTLLVTDQQQSVAATPELSLSYTAYGYRQPVVDSMNLPGFTGQRVDPVTGHYLLGNGYRAFNPVLMRFNSPDSLSPFGEGGLNAYGYCGGDPVNREDQNGHIFKFLKPLLRAIRVIKPSAPVSKADIDGSLEKVLKSDINKHYDKIIDYRDKVVRTRAIIARFDAKNKMIPEGLKDLDHDVFEQLSDLVGKVMPPPNYKWAALNKPISVPPAPVSTALAPPPTYEQVTGLLGRLPTYAKSVRTT